MDLGAIVNDIVFASVVPSLHLYPAAGVAVTEYSPASVPVALPSESIAALEDERVYPVPAATPVCAEPE